MNQVRKVVNDAQKTFPQNIKISFSQDSSKYINDMLGSLQNNVIAAIILVLIICSAVSGECDRGWEKQNINFSDWDSCMRQGYVESLGVMDLMGADYINKNKTYIKFYCKKIKKNEIDL